MDIIQVERIARFASCGDRYLKRVFTSGELRLADTKSAFHEFLAGRFAAKEAVAKSIGPPISWQEVEVLSGEDGEPRLALSGRAAQKASGGKVHISISHSQGVAVAMAVFETP